MINHSLHTQVAKAIDSIIKTNALPLTLELDQACGGNKHLSFFLSFVPSRESAISKADIVVLKDQKIKFICEIEESGFIPGKFFGKVFTSASAKICRLKMPNGFRYIDLDENAIFVQIVRNDSFQKSGSQKEKQGQLIENEIIHRLVSFNSWIKKYRMLFGDVNDFSPAQKERYIELERIIKAL